MFELENGKPRLILTNHHGRYHTVQLNFKISLYITIYLRGIKADFNLSCHLCFAMIVGVDTKNPNKVREFSAI